MPLENKARKRAPGKAGREHEKARKRARKKVRKSTEEGSEEALKKVRKRARKRAQNPRRKGSETAVKRTRIMLLTKEVNADRSPALRGLCCASRGKRNACTLAKLETDLCFVGGKCTDGGAG